MEKGIRKEGSIKPRGESPPEWGALLDHSYKLCLDCRRLTSELIGDTNISSFSTFLNISNKKKRTV